MSNYGLSKQVVEEVERCVRSEAVVDAWIRDDDGRMPVARKDRVNHASKIGHPCDRYLTLRRTHGDQGAPPSKGLAAIFRRGHALEQAVAVKQLVKAGWRVWDEQKTFDVVEKGEVLISCTIDCLTKPPGTDLTFVADHKVINPHDWQKMPEGWDGYEFLRDSQKPWLRSYPGQTISYMYAHPGAAEVGLLQFINAETLLPKFVYVPFDAPYMQSLIDRAYRINKKVAEVMAKGIGAAPAPIPWGETCQRCELLGICLPDQVGHSPLELIEDESFIELVEEDRRLAADKSRLEAEYKRVHDRIKHLIGDRERVGAGRFIITQKQISISERVQKAISYLRMDIREIEPKPKEVSEDEESAA